MKTKPPEGYNRGCPKICWI